MNVSSTCYLCGEPFKPGDPVYLHAKSTALAAHGGCVPSGPVLEVTAYRAPQLSFTEAFSPKAIARAARAHIEGGQALRDALQMYLDNCPACHGHGVMQHARPEEPVPSSGTRTAILASTCIPCVTALQVLRNTTPTPEE